MSPDSKAPGDIKIADDVIAEVAGYTALECYGVVGMANPSVKDDVAQLLSRDKLKRGVKVHSDQDKIKIDMYVILEYGTNLAEICSNLNSQVKYAVKRCTGLTVTDVHAHVQGIKVRK